MDKPYTGGCACGAIRYEIFGEPVFSNECQCRDCQQESGTGHGSHLTFPRAGVTVTGQARHWDMTADSGNVKTRAFCPDCGAPVYMTFAAMPDIFTIRAASPLQAAGGDLRRARTWLGSPRSGPAEIRADAAEVRR
jgi:hypothetical protein